MPGRKRFVIGLVAIAAALGHCASPAPARAAAKCVSAEEAAAQVAGDGPGGGEDEGAPPKFTAAFYARTLTLNASLDGLDGTTLPVSIEEVCDVPKALKKQAAQLAGTDGVALVSAHTRVLADGASLVGAAAMTALDGADTADIRVRLLPRQRWSEDEDGDKVPTFDARRAKITD